MQMQEFIDLFIDFNEISVTQFFSENGTLKEERSYRGNYKEGIWIMAGGDWMQKTPYVKDKINGTVEEIWKLQTIRTTQVVDDLYHGDYITYHKNGKIKSIQKYVKGVRHGESAGYFESGKYSYKLRSVHGKLEGTAYEWHENSRWLKSVTNWSQDKYHGIQKNFHEDGSLEMIGSYENGRRHGFFVEYNNNVQVISEREYEHGVQITLPFQSQEPDRPSLIETDVCPICFVPAREARCLVSLMCNRSHFFCMRCIKNYYKSCNTTARCPMCRSDIQ